MNKFKVILTKDEARNFEIKMEAGSFRQDISIRQNDVYFRNMDMESSISKHAIRLRHEIDANGGESYRMTFTVLSESSSDWAAFSEITSAVDENIYKMIPAVGFKRLAALAKKRTFYSRPFRMTKDDIAGFGSIIKVYYSDEKNREEAFDFFRKMGFSRFEARPNLQIFLEFIKNKTAANKDEGMKKVKTEVFRLLKEKERIVIGIAGGSGSGKTFISRELLSWLPDAVIFTLDDYYKDRTWINENLNSNFDDPAAINLDLACEHLRDLKAGKAIKRPKRSLEKGTVVGYTEVEPSRMLIVEGIFALHETFENIYDYSVFIEANLHGKLVRRLMRDIGKTGQDFEGIILQYVGTVQPMYEKHIEITKNGANLIINNEFAPFGETYDKIDKFEFKIRSAFNVPLKKLKEQGAELVSERHLVDKYYVAPGLNFTESDELLRIREENGDLTLTYKGPRKLSFQRPRIDFPINRKFAEVLLYLGYSNAVTSEKRRYKFKIADMPTLDIVVDEVKNFGTYIEARIPSAEDEKKARNFLRELGVNVDSNSGATYFEEILNKTFNV